MYEQTSMIGPQTAEVPAPAVRYYEINEETARNAHYCVHMSDYKPGSATAEYRRAVDKAAALAEAKKARVSPFYHDKLDALLDRYARRLAEWTNDYNRNQASYPSQFISGAGGYNMRKHEKQMSREGTLWNEYDEIKAILNKIEAVGSGPVDLADPHAREMLADQLQKLQNKLDESKALNAYYRKHKSFDGFPSLTAEAAAKLTASFADTQERCPWVKSLTTTRPAFAARSSGSTPASTSWTSAPSRPNSPPTVQSSPAVRSSATWKRTGSKSSLTKSLTRTPAPR